MTSIRASLLRWIAGGAVVVALLAGAATYALASRALRRQADDALLARARNFASLVILEQPDPDEDDPGGFVLDYKGSLEEPALGALLHVATLDGAPIAESPGWPAGSAPPLRTDSEDGDVLVAHAPLPDGRSARLVRLVTIAGAEPEIDEDEPESEAQDDELVSSDQLIAVTLLGSDEALLAAQRAVLAAIVMGSLAAGVGAWIIVALSVSRGLRPLDTLASQLRALPANHPRPLQRDHREPRELTPITTALDDLLQRVRDAMDRERRFTDAAAHELRTPLAELRALTDVAVKFPDPDRVEHAVREAGAVGAEMTNLIEALLLAARDESTSADAAVPTAIAPFVEESLRRRRADLESRSVTVECSLDPAAAWRALPGAAGMVVRNLIDNAADYTPHGGAIRISVTTNHQGARLDVRNGPTTLAPDAVGRIFEPFWRADASRADRAHRGLGLAIVAAQCQRSGLRYDASLSDTRELLVSITPNGA